MAIIVHKNIFKVMLKKNCSIFLLLFCLQDNKKKEIKRVSCPRDSCNLSFYNRVSLRYHIAEKHDNIYR